MDETGFLFRQEWLLPAEGCLVLFGLVLAFFNPLFLMNLVFNRQIDPYFRKTGDMPQSSQEFQSWIYGVLAAVIAGWGTFIFFLARHPFRAHEKWAWNCMIAGTAVWYSPDTRMSGAQYVFFDIFFNTVILILLVLPPVFTKKVLWKVSASAFIDTWLLTPLHMGEIPTCSLF